MVSEEAIHEFISIICKFFNYLEQEPLGLCFANHALDYCFHLSVCGIALLLCEIRRSNSRSKSLMLSSMLHYRILIFRLSSLFHLQLTVYIYGCQSQAC